MYLIYGSEQMFVKSYTKKLCEAVAGKNPSDFNYHTFSGDIDFQELAASLQIMPFMAERNCVVVTDIYFDNMVKDRLDTLKRAYKQSMGRYGSHNFNADLCSVKE